jgi:hypothetical protein
MGTPRRNDTSAGDRSREGSDFFELPGTASIHGTRRVYVDPRPEKTPEDVSRRTPADGRRHETVLGQTKSGREIDR